MHLKRRFSAQSFRKFVPLAAILAGTLACGLWLDSVTAGLFAFVLLFLLERIGRTLERIVGLLKTQPATTLPWSRSSSAETPNQRSIYISSKAMERLRPWVEDESSLTEESAKAYCSVLLDTLAMLYPSLAGKSQREESWS